jgi:hypothetical protein
MADYATESARKLLQELKMTAGKYAVFALSARKKYTSLMLNQEPEVRKIFIKAGDQVSKEILSLRNLGYGSILNDRYLEPLMKMLRETNISQSLREKMNQSIIKGVDAGTSYSFDITKLHISSAKIPVKPLERMIFRINKQAVDAMWARSENGLMLSDRIWQKGLKARHAMSEIIQDGIKNGEDPVKTARLLEQYVRRGKKTLSGDYPEMMERLGNRIPNDLSYEALRLVRLETAAAFGEGTIAAARVSPSYRGMKWVLSGAHPKPDICDELAGADHGMGRGIWPVGEEPNMPAHPNCLCVLIAVHEDLDQFMSRFNQWTKNPSSQPDLEDWYENVYSKVA